MVTTPLNDSLYIPAAIAHWASTSRHLKGQFTAKLEFCPVGCTPQSGAQIRWEDFLIHWVDSYTIQWSEENHNTSILHFYFFILFLHCSLLVWSYFTWEPPIWFSFMQPFNLVLHCKMFCYFLNPSPTSVKKEQPASSCRARVQRSEWAA